MPISSHRRSRASRSEEHTSELQSHLNLVCRLLPAKKKFPRALGAGDTTRSGVSPPHPRIGAAHLFAAGSASRAYRLFFFFLMIRRPPRSTLFPTRRSSDLVPVSAAEGLWRSAAFAPTTPPDAGTRL